MRKFLYSMLVAGALMFAATGCDKDPEVDNPNDDPNNPGQEVGTPTATVYAAEGVELLTPEDWKNVSKRTAEEWAEVTWVATSTVDLVRYETTPGDFDSGVYAHIIKVVRHEYDEYKAILTDPEKVDWLAKSQPVTTDVDGGTIVLLNGDPAKMNAEGETKTKVTLMTDEYEEIGNVTFRAEAATDVVTIAAAATGPWTAEITVDHLGGGDIFVFGIIPASGDVEAARTAFVNEAKESTVLAANGENSCYVYSLSFPNADFVIDGNMVTTSELMMKRVPEALKPDTEYKALVFACNMFEAAEDGMNNEYELAGGTAYYKVVEANFKTPAFDGTTTGDIKYEETRRNSTRVDLNVTVPATYTKVVYGFSASAVEAALMSATEGAVFAANTGEPFALTGKFAGNKTLNLYVAGITAEGKVAYLLQPVEQGAVAFDSIESFDKFTVLTDKVQNYEIADGVATLSGVRVGVQFTEHESGSDKITAKIKEVRYISSETALAYADVVANLTDETENTTKHEKAPGDLLLTVKLKETTPSNYSGEYYVYVMLVDEDGNYGEIAYLTNEAEGNFELLAEGGVAKTLKFEWEADDTNVDYSIWKQTVTGGSFDEWFKLEYANYNGKVTASAPQGSDVKEMYLVAMDCTKGVAVFEETLKPIVREFTKMFQDYPSTIHKSEEGDEVEIKGSMIYCLQGTTSVIYDSHDIGENGYSLGIRPMWQGEGGTVFALVVVNNSNELTLKAIGFVEEKADWTTDTHRIDMTNFNF